MKNRYAAALAALAAGILAGTEALAQGLRVGAGKVDITPAEDALPRDYLGILDRNEPIAVYYNYAMHAVTAGQLDLVSGDAPGTTSRYIEDSFDVSRSR